MFIFCVFLPVILALNSEPVRLDPLVVRDISEEAPADFFMPKTAVTKPVEFEISLHSNITIPEIRLPPVSNSLLPESEIIPDCDSLPWCIGLRKRPEPRSVADEMVIQTRDELREVLS